MQLWRIHCPSTPVSEAATDMRLMDVLSGDWMSVGTLHFLVYAEKVSSFVWAKMYIHMTTNNSIDMLTDIIPIHRRLKLIVSDSGPAFRNKYITKLREMMINHSPL